MLQHLRTELKSMVSPLLSSSTKAKSECLLKGGGPFGRDRALRPLPTNTTKAQRKFWFLSWKQWRPAATCGQQPASALHAVLQKEPVEGQRRLSCADWRPPVVKGTVEPPVCKYHWVTAPDLQIAFFKPSHQELLSGFHRLVSWGLGYDMAGQGLWSTVSSGGWSLCDGCPFWIL